MSGKKSDTRIYELDLIKVIGILLILICHFDPGKPDYTMYYYYSGFIGVILFLFASGYSLYSSSLPLLSLHDISIFVKKRIERIYPLYWVALFIFFLLYPLLNLQWYYWLIHALGLMYFFPLGTIPDPGQLLILWFIEFIILMYIFYIPITYGAISRKRLIIQALVVFGTYLILAKTFNIFGGFSPAGAPPPYKNTILVIVFFGGIFAASFNVFGITQKYMAKIPSQLKSIILFGSFSAYAVYLFHIPAKTLWLSIIDYFHLSGVPVTILFYGVFFLVLFGICYFIQRSYNLLLCSAKRVWTLVIVPCKNQMGKFN